MRYSVRALRLAASVDEGGPLAPGRDDGNVVVPDEGGPLAPGRDDGNVVVPGRSPARVEPRLRLKPKVLVHALRDLLAFTLGRAVPRGHEELVHRGVEHDLFASRVVEETRAVVADVLHDAPGAVHVAAETRLVAHDRNVHLARLDRVEERDEAARAS
jgi:hypothetical protein